MIYVNKHKKLLFIIFGLLYFLAGYLYISGYDIKTYNIPWILAFKNTNLLHLYDRSFLSPYAFYLPSGLITGCDFWLFISLFMIKDTSVIIRNFGLVFIFISILIGYITYKKTHDFILSIYIYMLSVFMITLKQLDRYFVYFFIINIYMVFISHIHVNRYKISLIIAFCCNIIFLILDSLTFDKSLIIYAIFAELIASLVFCTEYINILRYVLKNKIKQKED